MKDPKYDYNFIKSAHYFHILTFNEDGNILQNIKHIIIIVLF